VKTADGLPIYHEVFDGNKAEASTLITTVQKVQAQYAHIKRLIMVADVGLLTLDNLN
jgi:transposase